MGSGSIPPQRVVHGATFLMGGDRLQVSIIRESGGAPRGSGVYTAFLQVVERLSGRDDVSLHINSFPPSVDVVHAQTTQWRYFIASLRYRPRLVVSAHEVPDTYLGSFVFDQICRQAVTPLLRAAFNRARVVIAVSPYVKRELERIGVTSEIVILCNGVDRSRFRPDPATRSRLRAEMGISDSAFVVANAGQIQPRKGVEAFLQVASELPEMQFVWLGGRPFGRLTAQYSRLTRLIREAPPHVRFPGQVPIEDMPAQYAIADACLFPSVQECFGYTIVEAAATGLPVVVQDNPAYRDYLFDHCLVGSSVADFVAILRRLHEDPAYRRERVVHSGTLAALHDLDGYIERLLSLYRRVATEAAHGGCEARTGGRP